MRQQPTLYGDELTVEALRRTLFQAWAVCASACLICVNAALSLRDSLELSFADRHNDMTIHRRSLRQATWLILAVWLFAMGTGVANACFLNERLNDSHLSIQATPHDVLVAESHHDAPTDHTDAGCLKFCNEAPLAIPKVDQPTADGSPGWVGVLSRISPPTLSAATAVLLREHANRPAHMASPIAARPHRLTL